VKTTVELPPELLRMLKIEAARQGRTIKELLIEALRDKLQPRPTQGGWQTVFGKAKPAAVRDVEARLRDFERIDLDSWR
jgi:hypothetical protein